MKIFKLAAFVAVVGIVGAAIPLALYLRSDFFGWSAPRGVELETVVVFAGAIVLVLFLITALRKRINWKVSLAGLLAFSLGSIGGGLAPWVGGDPFWGKVALPLPEEVFKVPRIAHAGGSVGTVVYSNSLEALETNKEFFQLFELDFLETSDGNLVCLHDWEQSAEKMLGSRFEKPISLQEFDSLVRKNPELTACNLKTLSSWLDENPDKKIVTDVKSDSSAEFLRLLAIQYPRLVDRFIPQIYHPDEYPIVKAAGFKDIIFTLYRSNLSDNEVLGFANSVSLYAVTMDSSRVGQLSLDLNSAGIPVYAHTINDLEWWAQLRDYGVSNIYTDFLKATQSGY